MIVGSILLALALDASWDALQEAERRADLLDGLSSDFAVVAAQLNETLLTHQSALQAAERVLGLAHSGEVSASDAPVVDSLLSRIWEPSTIDPPMGTLQALVSSGELGVLENPDLRRELTAWPAIFSDFQHTEDLALAHVLQVYAPFLRRHGINTNDLSWGLGSLPWEPAETEAYRLLSDPEFQGILGDSWFRWRALVYKGGVISTRVSRIRSLIDVP